MVRTVRGSRAGSLGSQERVLRSGKGLADSWKMNRHYVSKEKEIKFQKRRYLVQMSEARESMDLKESSKNKEKSITKGLYGYLW